MPNTAAIPGSNDIKTFIKAARSKTAAQVMDLLNVHDDTSYQRAVDLMGELMDLTGDDPTHPLNTFMELLTDSIERYENEHFPIEKPTPGAMLQFFMEQHSLSQTDLSKELGGQSVVSQILSGKRELNLRQIRALSERFGVSASVFV